MGIKSDLTSKQQQVWNYIQTCILQDHCPPTVRQIMLQFHWHSPQSARKHILALEQKGYLKRQSKTSRGILLSHSPSLAIALPILGKVSAGIPLLAEENQNGTILVDAGMVRNRKNLFVLEIRGDSMIDSHILPGDKVIVQQTAQAESGDIIVALIDGEATVKYFKKINQQILLMPANPKYKPILIKDQEFRVIGKVVGVISVRQS
jgi:repressor LexA